MQLRHPTRFCLDKAIIGWRRRKKTQQITFTVRHAMIQLKRFYLTNSSQLSTRPCNTPYESSNAASDNPVMNFNTKSSIPHYNISQSDIWCTCSASGEPACRSNKSFGRVQYQERSKSNKSQSRCILE
jgi:hypothetical protein